MSKVKIELNLAGINELMKSPEIQEALTSDPEDRYCPFCREPTTYALAETDGER